MGSNAEFALSRALAENERLARELLQARSGALRYEVCDEHAEPFEAEMDFQAGLQEKP